MPEEYRLATIYRPVNTIYCKIECKLIDHGDRRKGTASTKPFVYYILIAKLKKKTYAGDDFVILEGHGHPDPPSGWVDEESVGEYVDIESGAVNLEHVYRSRRSKYHIFDPRFRIEFNEFINHYDGRFLADYRCDKSTVLSEEEKDFIARTETPRTIAAEPTSVLSASSLEAVS